MLDVLIIGAGPAGLYCAKRLKKSGLNIRIIEEHSEIGVPLQCSGLVSWNLEKFISPDVSYIENIINSAVIHSPSGHTIKLEKRKPVYVLDRSLFDKSLSKGIENDIIYDTKGISVEYGRNSVKVHTSKGVYESKMIIASDGPSSFIAKYFNVSPKTAIGLIAVVKEEPVTDSTELFFDKRYTDNFLWKIPRKHHIEYGMMGENPKKEQLEQFFGIKDYKLSGGLIPIEPAKRTYFNRCILLGDAAGQVKPWSGGGVIYSLTCGQMAASVIKEAFRNNDLSAKFLSSYEKEWKRKIGKQITAGNIWNHFLKKSNNFTLDIFFSCAKLIPFNKTDMDFLVQ